MIVTSDAHGGAALADYKPYLAARWQDEFDDWLSAVVMPWFDVNDTTNWDNDLRMANMDADGVSAEIVFPNTLPPFFDILAHLSGVPRERVEFERRWADCRLTIAGWSTSARRLPSGAGASSSCCPTTSNWPCDELQWAAATGIVAGVMLPAVPPNHPVEPYFHERYDPLWRASIETGLPVHQHQGTGSPTSGRMRRWPARSSSPSSSAGPAARCTI